MSCLCTFKHQRRVHHMHCTKSETRQLRFARGHFALHAWPLCVHLRQPRCPNRRSLHGATALTTTLSPPACSCFRKITHHSRTADAVIMLTQCRHCSRPCLARTPDPLPCITYLGLAMPAHSKRATRRCCCLIMHLAQQSVTCSIAAAWAYLIHTPVRQTHPAPAEQCHGLALLCRRMQMRAEAGKCTLAASYCMHSHALRQRVSLCCCTAAQNARPGRKGPRLPCMTAVVLLIVLEAEISRAAHRAQLTLGAARAHAAAHAFAAAASASRVQARLLNM